MGGQCPNLEKSWPASVKYVMEKYWLNGPVTRPTFETVSIVLSGYITLYPKLLDKYKSPLRKRRAKLSGNIDNRQVHNMFSSFEYYCDQ